MSVAFANAFVAGMRYNGVHVKFESGWERRGNGQSFPAAGPEGPLTHHTGGPYDGGYSLLVHGRSDLRGPLCNICTWADGSITLIAAHPSNNAGAAGGSWARPYPDTRSFNRLVWGNEVMYPGTRPWTPAQYRTARIAAAVVCGIRKRGSEWARAHYETSVTGKWDPGIGNGRHEWFPFDRFRADLWDALKSAPPEQEDDMALTPEQDTMLREVHHQLHGPWQTRRYDGADQELTLVDLSRKLDEKIVSKLDLDGRPGTDTDDLFGHLLSLRAEVRELAASLGQGDETEPGTV